MTVVEHGSLQFLLIPQPFVALTALLGLGSGYIIANTMKTSLRKPWSLPHVLISAPLLAAVLIIMPWLFPADANLLFARWITGEGRWSISTALLRIALIQWAFFEWAVFGYNPRLEALENAEEVATRWTSNEIPRIGNAAAILLERRRERKRYSVDKIDVQHLLMGSWPPVLIALVCSFILFGYIAWRRAHDRSQGYTSEDQMADAILGSLEMRSPQLATEITQDLESRSMKFYVANFYVVMEELVVEGAVTKTSFTHNSVTGRTYELNLYSIVPGQRRRLGISASSPVTIPTSNLVNGCIYPPSTAIMN
jgi:hypothetical protein